MHVSETGNLLFRSMIFRHFNSPPFHLPHRRFLAAVLVLMAALMLSLTQTFAGEPECPAGLVCEETVKFRLDYRVCENLVRGLHIPDEKMGFVTHDDGRKVPVEFFFISGPLTWARNMQLPEDLFARAVEGRALHVVTGETEVLWEGRPITDRAAKSFELHCRRMFSRS